MGRRIAVPNIWKWLTDEDRCAGCVQRWMARVGVVDYYIVNDWPKFDSLDQLL